jgi:hypothetical protein
MEREQKPPEQTLFMIDVPNHLEKNPLWCGWTSASEIVQYFGYTNLTSERIFAHVNGEYDREREHIVPTSSPKPTIDTLAMAIDELTDLKPRILSKEDFDKIKERKPEFQSPHDVLQYYIKRKIPAIVRTPGHFLVTRGVDMKREKYMFNNPLIGRITTMSFDQFDHSWAAKESNYPRDTQYLMLTVSTRKKQPRA